MTLPGGGSFCGECGAALPSGAGFCGSCGAPTGAPPEADDQPAVMGGASTWTGVTPIVERPEPELAPPPPPVAGDGPPPVVAPAGGGGTKGKGPLIAVLVLVLAALGVGGFVLLGGSDDDDEVAADDTTTTTEDDDGTTTTTEEVDDTTTTTASVDDPLAGITFTELVDSTGNLQVQVPDDWTDVSLDPLTDEGKPTIQASTDLEAFRTGFDVPGMSFSLIFEPPADFDGAIDFLAALVNLDEACTATGKEDYSDGVFTGRFEVFEDCGGVDTTIVQIVASREDGLTIEVSVQLRPEDPIEIVRHVAETFNAVG